MRSVHCSFILHYLFYFFFRIIVVVVVVDNAIVNTSKATAAVTMLQPEENDQEYCIYDSFIYNKSLHYYSPRVMDFIFARHYGENDRYDKRLLKCKKDPTLACADECHLFYRIEDNNETKTCVRGEKCCITFTKDAERPRSMTTEQFDCNDFRIDPKLTTIFAKIFDKMILSKTTTTTDDDYNNTVVIFMSPSLGSSSDTTTTTSSSSSSSSFPPHSFPPPFLLPQKCCYKKFNNTTTTTTTTSSNNNIISSSHNITTQKKTTSFLEFVYHNNNNAATTTFSSFQSFSSSALPLATVIDDNCHITCYEHLCHDTCYMFVSNTKMDSPCSTKDNKELSCCIEVFLDQINKMYLIHKTDYGCSSSNFSKEMFFFMVKETWGTTTPPPKPLFAPTSLVPTIYPEDIDNDERAKTSSTKIIPISNDENYKKNYKKNETVTLITNPPSYPHKVKVPSLSTTPTTTTIPLPTHIKTTTTPPSLATTIITSYQPEKHLPLNTINANTTTPKITIVNNKSIIIILDYTIENTTTTFIEKQNFDEKKFSIVIISWIIFFVFFLIIINTVMIYVCKSKYSRTLQIA